MFLTIFEAGHKKLIFGPKNTIFGPKKGHFWQFGPRNGLPSLKMQFLWSQFHFSPNDPNLLFLVSGQWKPNRQHYCVDPVARRASGWLPWPILCSKFCIFLGYTYKRPVFGLGRTRLNAIISVSCPEETLDSFSFTVGGRLAGRFSASRPDFGHFGPLPNCYNRNTLNFGPW